ncbi:MAG: ribosomal protein S18-alanine N-acetyltransferase [Corynebacterium sp.]|nr:ribosomal protein S18-alanine N-acetyltransferase [Corynebacterium sp.]
MTEKSAPVDIALRLVQPADIARMVELEEILFAEEDPWSEEAFLAEFSLPYNQAIVAVASNKPDYLLGYVIISMLGNENPEFEIHNIAVDPAYQGQGIGGLLMENAIHVADLHQGPTYLEVRTDNDPAIRLYERCGFTKAGVRKNYYQPSGADAYTMVRPAQEAAQSPADTEEGEN